MSTGGWEERKEPEIGERVLAICREVRFDAATPDSPYTLSGLLSVLRPAGPFPLIWHEPVCLYAE